MSRVFLLLGSNLGDRLSALEKARHHISRDAGKIITTSSIFQTAHGAIYPNPILQSDDWNSTSYRTCWNTPNYSEYWESMGRERLEKWGSRLIDIDILLGSQQIQQPDLVVPHPYLHMRRFALTPLVEIAPDVVHPMPNKTMTQLLDECVDQLPVKQGEPINSSPLLREQSSWQVLATPFRDRIQ